MKKVMKKIGLSLLIMMTLTVQLDFLIPGTIKVKAAEEMLAQKPYMGWSSYSLQVYDGPGGNWTSAQKIKQQSDAMKEKLQSHGYEYINIDAGWSEGFDEYGRPVPSKTLYPDGFQSVIDYVHTNGQKIGIYMIPGLSKDIYNSDCKIKGTDFYVRDIVEKPLKIVDAWGAYTYKIDFSKPEAQQYIDSIADLLNEWGINFVKFDSVTPGSGTNNTSLDARGDVAAWSQALHKYNIWFELSWALDHNYVETWKKYADGWRVDWDVEAYDSKKGMVEWGTIARLFPDAATWWRDAGPEGWNDFDSLNVGNALTSGLTKDERQTAATLWAASCAQFFTGDDMTKLDDYGLELLTNDEVIAVDQGGHPVHPLSTDTQQQVWYSNNGDGTYTVALFNLGTKAAKLTVNWKEIGITGSASVRDLWSHQELGTYDNGYTVSELPPHGSRLFKVNAQNGTSTLNDDDTGILYNGTWMRNGEKEVVKTSQDLNVEIGWRNSISPAAGSFFKDSQADITTSISSGSKSLTDIKNGSSSLVKDQDYSISGNIVTIKKEYLGDKADGVLSLEFIFEAGNTQTFDITIKSSSELTYSVIINDNDSGITYSPGQWGYQDGRSQGDYNADIHYTGNNSAYYEYTFNGTGIDIITERHSQQGNNEVYLDDIDSEHPVTPVIVDTSAPSGFTPQQKVYSIAGLPMGKHKIKVVKTSGEYMQIDAFKVYSDDLITKVTGNFNKDAQEDVTTDLVNGSDSLTSIKNGTAVLEKNTNYMASGNTLTIKKEYLAQQPNGTAKLVFNFAGGESQVMNVSISGTTAAQPFILINDNDKGIKYSEGQWGYDNSSWRTDYKKDLHYTTTDGAYYEYSFMGTGIEIITEKNIAQGNNDVYLDDNPVPVTIDTSSSTVNSSQETLYKVTGLDNTIQHKIKVVKSSGGYMQLDALKVYGHNLITQVSGSFNKQAQEDVTTTLVYGSSSFIDVGNGLNTLEYGKDYSVSDDTVAIKKEYLAKQPNGIANLTFSFTAGVRAELSVDISGLTVENNSSRSVDINNDDPGIVYNGSWSRSGSRPVAGDYMEDVQYTMNNGDAFQYSFKGTGIDVITEMHSSQGDMEIILDSVSKGTVSTYLAEGRLARQTVYSISGLSDGLHTIRCIKKSGDYMLLDELRVQIPNLIGPIDATFDTNPAVSTDLKVAILKNPALFVGITNGTDVLENGTDYLVSGTEVTLRKEYLTAQTPGNIKLAFNFNGDYQNDVHFTEKDGDSFQYSFTGTGIKLLGAKGPEMGNMDIYIDDVLNQTVNAHSDTRQVQQELFEIKGLSDAIHTIKGVKSSGNVMLVDQLIFDLHGGGVAGASQPELLSAAISADGKTVSLEFNKEMASPAGNEGQFNIQVNGKRYRVTTSALGAVSSRIELKLEIPITPGQTATVEYMPGTVAAADGRQLPALEATAISNLSNIKPFSISAASLKKSGGIYADARIVPNGIGGHATVIFRLMDGANLVETMISEVDITSPMDVSARFLSYSGSNYSVEVLVWNHVNDRLTNSGIDLAEPVTLR